MNTDRLLALGLTQLWQVSLAITVIGPIACVVFRRRPHWAYALWLLVLVKTITPPLWSSPTGVFSWLAAERAVGRVEQPADAAPALHPAAALSASAAAAQPDFTAKAELPPLENRPAGRVISTLAISTSAIVLAIWAAAAVGVVSLAAAVSLTMLRRLRRGAREPSPELAKLFGDMRSAIGAGRRVRLVISGERFGPALVGLVRPQIVLPSVLIEEKPTSELAPILAHELVHLRRGDHWIAHLQLLAQALWWFHPLVWWMNRQLGRTREMGCDEEVLATLNCQPADYAQILLDVVRLRRVEQPFRTMPLALSMQSAEFAAVRLTHIMSGSLRFHRRTPAACWAAAVFGALLVLPGAGLLAQNPAAKDDQPAAGAKAAGDKTDAGPATGQLASADKPAEEPAGETMVRTVVDGESGKPLADVHVTVEHVILPASGQKVIATTKYVSDKEGRYKIEIPASELEHPTLSLRFAIDEPGYAPPAAIQYGVQYFRESRRRGVPIPFDVDRIYPGEEVTGTIEDPQGKPVADLPVHVLSMLALNPVQAEEAARLAKLAAENDESGATATFSANPPVRSQTVVRTDAQGRFRFTALKQGMRHVLGRAGRLCGLVPIGRPAAWRHRQDRVGAGRACRGASRRRRWPAGSGRVGPSRRRRSPPAVWHRQRPHVARSRDRCRRTVSHRAGACGPVRGHRRRHRRAERLDRRQPAGRLRPGENRRACRSARDGGRNPRHPPLHPSGTLHRRRRQTLWRCQAGDQCPAQRQAVYQSRRER